MLLTKRVAQFLDSVEASLWPLGTPCRLLVGVSGGPDSLVLLHVLKELVGPDRLVAAHLNHGLRTSAAAEARLVAETAARWGITCILDEMDVRTLANEKGMTLEEAGRYARYQFLARQAAVAEISVVAVAHNADDQAETVLMHIMRGAGLAGLRGMLAVAPMPGSAQVTLIRPLLQVERTEIEGYCKEHRLQPVEDQSNQDTTFFRNWLRHRLLPLMVEHNPQIKRRLRQTAELVAADYAFLEEQLRQKWAELLLDRGESWLFLNPAGWPALSLSMRRAILRHAVTQLRPHLRDVGFRTIEHARRVVDSGQVGARATLPAGLILTVGYQQISIAATGRILHMAPQLASETPVLLPIPGRVELAHGWCLEASFVEAIELSQIKNNPDRWVAYAIPSAHPLQIRRRLPGERFQPLGMQGKSASVKEVMINRKIEADLRPAWPLVTNPDHLVWLVGHHLDHRVRVTSASQRVVRLHCFRLPESRRSQAD